MEYIRQHLTVDATVTDEYLWSIYHTLTDNFTDIMYSSVCHKIIDGINSSVYFKRETFFFGAQFPFVKPAANVFLCFRPI